MSEWAAEASFPFLSGTAFFYPSNEFFGTDMRLSLALSLIAIPLVLPMVLLVMGGIRQRLRSPGADRGFL